MKRETLDRLNADRAAKRPVALVTETASGGQWLVYADAGATDAALPEDMLAEARTALADDRSATSELNGTSYFIQVHNPPLRI